MQGMIRDATADPLRTRFRGSHNEKSPIFSKPRDWGAGFPNEYAWQQEIQKWSYWLPRAYLALKMLLRSSS